MRQIFIDDIPQAVDEAFIYSMFKECGPIIPGGIILKQHKTNNKKYAFITFEQHESAQNAISDMNYTKLDGIPIRIKWADPESKNIKHSHDGEIIIRGLDESIEVAQLHEAFSNFGEVFSCNIPLDEDGRSCGYGMVHFVDPQNAQRVIEELLSINGKQIQITLAH